MFRNKESTIEFSKIVKSIIILRINCMKIEKKDNFLFYYVIHRSYSIKINLKAHIYIEN